MVRPGRRGGSPWSEHPPSRTTGASVAARFVGMEPSQPVRRAVIQGAWDALGHPGTPMRGGRVSDRTGEGAGAGTGRGGGVRVPAAGVEGTHGPQLRLTGPPSPHEHLDPAPLLRGRRGPRRLRPGRTLRRPVRRDGRGTPGTPPPLAPRVGGETPAAGGLGDASGNGRVGCGGHAWWGGHARYGGRIRRGGRASRRRGAWIGAGRVARGDGASRVAGRRGAAPHRAGRRPSGCPGPAARPTGHGHAGRPP